MIIRWTLTGTKTRFAQLQYISEQNPKAADDLDLELISQVRLLAEHPLIGRVGRLPGTRALVIARTPYIAIYRVKQKEVEILRILHHAQRWP